MRKGLSPSAFAASVALAVGVVDWPQVMVCASASVVWGLFWASLARELDPRMAYWFASVATVLGWELCQGRG